VEKNLPNEIETKEISVSHEIGETFHLQNRKNHCFS